MALVKATLQAAILAAFQKAQADKTAGSLTSLCADLATALDTYVKTATVTGVTSTPIPVTVILPAGTGGTTAAGTVTGTLS
jgi:hypothetical protein